MLFTTESDLSVNDDLENYIRDQGVLKIFIRQLQFRDSALLAAYALTKCLNYGLSMRFSMAAFLNIAQRAWQGSSITIRLLLDISST